MYLYLSYKKHEYYHYCTRSAKNEVSLESKQIIPTTITANTQVDYKSETNYIELLLRVSCCKK